MVVVLVMAMTHGLFSNHSVSPSQHQLILLPFLLLLHRLFLLCGGVTTWPRADLKRLAPLNVVSNLALLVAFLVILYMTITSVAHHHTASTSTTHQLLHVDLRKLPLSFGNVVASYEGIGTVLCVEGGRGSAIR